MGPVRVELIRVRDAILFSYCLGAIDLLFTLSVLGDKGFLDTFSGVKILFLSILDFLAKA
jgi:hypothetical protein